MRKIEITIPEGCGAIHCTNCETPIAFVLPDTEVSDDLILEAYCMDCLLKELLKGKHG